MLEELQLKNHRCLSSFCVRRVSRRNADNLERLIVTGTIEGKRYRQPRMEELSEELKKRLVFFVIIKAQNNAYYFYTYIHACFSLNNLAH